MCEKQPKKIAKSRNVNKNVRKMKSEENLQKYRKINIPPHTAIFCATQNECTTQENESHNYARIYLDTER